MDDPGKPNRSDPTWSSLADSDFVDRHHHHHILTDFGWTDLDHGPLDPPDAPSSAPLSASCSGSQFPDRSSEATHASVSSSSSEDPPEKSGSTTAEAAAPSPEIPSKMMKKKGQKRVRQQRFAFMTKSEVDHLEDGYRWRKYGQKAVKNSPFPRSYYRCTNTKCTVKKRVERSSEDPTMVITTYEGQHCHHTVGFQRSITHEPPFLGHFPPPSLALTPQFVYPPTPPPGMQFSPRDHSVSMNAQVEESPPLTRPPPPTTGGEGLLGDIVPPGMRNP